MPFASVWGRSAAGAAPALKGAAASVPLTIVPKPSTISSATHAAAQYRQVLFFMSLHSFQEIRSRDSRTWEITHTPVKRPYNYFGYAL
jgi:hypothetical protein